MGRMRSSGEKWFSFEDARHGFENPDREAVLRWMMSPAGLDRFFVETCAALRKNQRRI